MEVVNPISRQPRHRHASFLNVRVEGCGRLFVIDRVRRRSRYVPWTPASGGALHADQRELPDGGVTNESADASQIGTYAPPDGQYDTFPFQHPSQGGTASA
jgi:hypothetical protein